MRPLLHQPSPQGTGLPTIPGVVIERITYDPAADQAQGPVTVRAVASPLAAVRALRADLHDTVGPALAEAAASGRLAAIAALHRGEEAVFTLPHPNGPRTAWRLRPVRLLPLTAPAPCPRRPPHSSRKAEAAEERLAGQRLREVAGADREAFGPVSAEARRQAEREW